MHALRVGSDDQKLLGVPTPILCRYSVRERRGREDENVEERVKGYKVRSESARAYETSRVRQMGEISDNTCDIRSFIFEFRELNVHQ